MAAPKLRLEGQEAAGTGRPTRSREVSFDGQRASGYALSSPESAALAEDVRPVPLQELVFGMRKPVQALQVAR